MPEQDTGLEFTLSACISCRKAKRKCDAGIPKCKHCFKTGLKCEFYDATSKEPVPREKICQLEERLKHLLERKKKRERLKTSRILKEKRVGSYLSDEINLTPTSDENEQNSENLFLGQSSGLQLAQLLMEKVKGVASVPFPAEDSGPLLQVEDPKPILSLPPLSTFLYLVSLYIEQSEVRYPIFLRSSLMELVVNVYHNISRDTQSLCAINLIMAISLQISSRNDIRLVSLAREYFKEAMPYLKETCYDMKDIRTLQCLLLTIIYSLLNPSAIPVWQLAGITMRMCLDLGIHKDEIICQNETDPLQIDLARRLWWSQYAVDRGLSLTAGRPLTIPDEIITTKYPSILEDACIANHEKISVENLTKKVTDHWLDLRRLQSEIIGKLYQSSNQKLNSQDPWFRDMYKRFEIWRDTATLVANGPLNKDWTMHGFYNGIMLMNRPSYANPSPSNESYMICFEAASANLIVYRNMVVTKSIDITWLICHYLFICGITLLYSYYCAADVRERHSITELNDGIKICCFCLEQITEKWPAASGMLKAFHALSGFVVKAFNQDETTSEDVAISLEDRLGDETDKLDLFWEDFQVTGMSEQDILNQIFLNYPYPNDEDPINLSWVAGGVESA